MTVCVAAMPGALGSLARETHCHCQSPQTCCRPPSCAGSSGRCVPSARCASRITEEHTAVDGGCLLAGRCAAVLAGMEQKQTHPLGCACSLHAHAHLLSTESSRWCTSLSLFVLDSSQLVMAGEDLWSRRTAQQGIWASALLSRSVAGLPAASQAGNNDAAPSSASSACLAMKQ